MHVLEKLSKALDQIGVAEYSFEENQLTYMPENPDGFEVSIVANGGSWTVAYEGWHEEFSSDEEAFNCFMFGLTKKCRLKVERRGTFPHKWTVEWNKDGDWRLDSITGLILFPFWKRRNIIYLQNTVEIE